MRRRDSDTVGELQAWLEDIRQDYNSLQFEINWAETHDELDRLPELYERVAPLEELFDDITRKIRAEGVDCFATLD